MKYIVDESSLTRIADACREVFGVTTRFNLMKMASAVRSAKREGINQAYDEFEDNYTENGTRTRCKYMYSGAGWNANTFKPKNKLTPTDAPYMFAYHNRQTSWDYPEYDLPTEKFDFSKVTNAERMFWNARFVSIDVDLSSATYLDHCFQGSDGGRIQHISVKIISKANFSNTFTYLAHLKTFRLKEGSVIQHNGFDIRQSTQLDKESFVSIVNALSASTSGYSVHLSLVAVNKAFETSEGANDGSTSTEWTTLVATKQNWTISLV